MREKCLELVIELRRQRLIVRHHDGWPVRRLNHLGHGVSLARPGDPQQNLMLLAVEHTPHQRLDSRALITLRFVFADEPEIHKLRFERALSERNFGE